MNIKDLKLNIERGTLTDDQMVWKITDKSSYVITEQYIKAISKNKNLELKIIDSLNEIPDSGFIEDNNLYILYSKEFNDEINKNNCIIICEKTSLDSIKIPKLEKWQLDDYIINKLPGINKNELLWWSSQYGENYFKLLNEVDKIKLFSKGNQGYIYDLLQREGAYDDITPFTIWDLSNAILRRDKEMISKVLEVINYIDIDPIGILTVLYNNFRRVIDIQTNPKAVAQDLGISDKQLYAIKKNNCGYYSRDELIRIFKLLTSLEYKYKFEGLSLNNLIDYLICNILEG